MPVTTTYPGVYIEEIPSGVHTITGVATSVGAFMGWAGQGPTDSAQLVLSFSEFVGLYGGLDSRSLLGYAVSHFFANGGQQAYIVRLVDGTATAASVTLAATGGNLILTAVNQGQWAKSYGVTIKNQASGNRFRIQVVYNPTGATAPVVVESFENLSVISPDTKGRYFADVLKAQSTVITGSVSAPVTAPPIDTTAPQMLTGGLDGTVLTPALPPSAAGAFESALLPTSGIGGVHYLEHVDIFNILCVPALADPATISSLEAFCVSQYAVLLVDSGQTDTVSSLKSGPSSSITGASGTNAAFYFPWLTAPDPLNQNRPATFPPCGFVAGVYARTDANRGVWKAPAGTEASVTGVSGVATALTDSQNGVLNPIAVNCIRNFPVYGPVIWGARTLQGNDEIGSEWKYVPIRRLALYIEQSLRRGTKWVVFEPNDEPLWAQIRLNVGAFMQTLFRQGAFQGSSRQQAYFVKCDSETTTPTDQNLGVVNILVGFAPLKPAEFVIIKIQQLAGQPTS